MQWRYTVLPRLDQHVVNPSFFCDMLLFLTNSDMSEKVEDPNVPLMTAEPRFIS